ncbi:hypothetical protein C8R42DRAFT_720874 [Lentinula raphanica]|nr:hypothetical protein C8R42DRAFT_720874 [Lentinula raphanica]
MEYVEECQGEGSDHANVHDGNDDGNGGHDHGEDEDNRDDDNSPSAHGGSLTSHLTPLPHWLSLVSIVSSVLTHVAIVASQDRSSLKHLCGNSFKIFGGRGADRDENDDDGDEEEERDEEAALAPALGISTGGTYAGDENLEAQVLACRRLANLMEALPGVAHTVVYHGAIPVLGTIVWYHGEDIQEFLSSIVREGGLAALIDHLDFFSIAVQRTALQAAANCCRNVSSDHFPMIRGFACLCVIRVIDSYNKFSVENLESLADTDLVQAVNQLLMPAGGSPLITANTYALLLRALSAAIPKITVFYHPRPQAHQSREMFRVAKAWVGDMNAMENLAPCSKDIVEETLSFISELIPPSPKDGVFDHKTYSEKTLTKLIEAKAKADKAARAVGSSGSRNVEAMSITSSTPNNSAIVSTGLLRSKPSVVGRFMQLTVPILIDVYAASVNTPVRVKTLIGLLEAASFLGADGLKQVLKFVPVEGFASSILSSRDHAILVVGALQLAELLSSKSKEKVEEEKEKEEKELSDSGTPDATASAPIIPGYKRLASLTLDPEDAITVRARIMKFKYLSGDDQAESDHTLEALKTLVDRIGSANATEQELSEAFELLQSGLAKRSSGWPTQICD